MRERRYIVITENRCPCEDCCGENIAEPEVEEFHELREAVEAFWAGGPDVEEGAESSSWPPSGSDWFSRFGHNYGGGCDDENTAWSRSFHVCRFAKIGVWSRRRILRLLGVKFD